MTFSYDLTDKLRRKVDKLARKDKVLALVFKRKLQEVVRHSVSTIDTYKNLRSPQNEFKRIHLTNKFILLFKVDKERMHIVFVDILAWDIAYR